MGSGIPSPMEHYLMWKCTGDRPVAHSFANPYKCPAVWKSPVQAHRVYAVRLNAPFE